MRSYSRKRYGIKGKKKKSELSVSSAKMKAIDFERLNVSYHDLFTMQTNIIFKRLNQTNNL